MTKLLTMTDVAEGTVFRVSNSAEKFAEALRAKNAVVEQFRNAFDECPIGAFIDDRNGNCFYINKAFADITGTSDMLGDKWKLRLHPDYVPVVESRWKDFSHSPSGSKYDTIERFIHIKTGAVTPCRVTSTREESGDFIGFVQPVCTCPNDSIHGLS